MVILLYKWFFASLLVSLPYFTDSQPDKYISPHPFFISVTEISHNATDKHLEISCKIFTDDFETALLKSTGVKIDLFNPKDKALAEKQIAAYLKKHLVIKLDSKPVILEFVGFEREDEAVWSYLQVSNTAAPKKMDISNDLLYESFDQQINLMHVSVSGNRKSTKLNYPDVNTSFQF
ncbi:MAG: hypothetical protein H7122_12820 [Chitinophagaceae bacterium]|nr:hypothetical protein [Chitinophagaceae bacterium]